MRLLELKNTSRPLFDWKLQVIAFLVEKTLSESASKAPREVPKRLQTASGRSPGTFQESIWSSEAALGVFRCPRGPLSGRSGTHQYH